MNLTNPDSTMKNAGETKRFLRFFLPSLLGTFFFLIPVRSQESWTIPVGVLSDMLTEYAGDYLPIIVLGIVTISAILSCWYSLIKSPQRRQYTGLRRIFLVSPLWLTLRLSGLVFALLIFFKWGPEFIWADSTGHVVLYDLATTIVTIFIFASLLLPLLTDFGLMELIGTVFRNIFRKLFKLPGRSCIDAVASWMAAAPVGVFITSQQYERGYYSGREAAVIATNFSVVSLPFCVLVAQFSGLDHLFFPYYLTVTFSGLVTAMILPRIPPLSRKADQYSELGQQVGEEVPRGDSLFRWGLNKAVAKADSAPGPLAYLQSTVGVLFDVCFGLMPPLMVIATLGLVLVEYTPVMNWLSYPLIPLLELLRLPEAAAAAPALLVGFADMFLPAVLAKGIESELTRFVIVSVSITQLIYLSEVGVMILKSRIPLNFWDLAIIFLLRTAISLPIITAIAHWLVF